MQIEIISCDSIHLDDIRLYDLLASNSFEGRIQYGHEQRLILKNGCFHDSDHHVAVCDDHCCIQKWKVLVLQLHNLNACARIYYCCWRWNLNLKFEHCCRNFGQSMNALESLVRKVSQFWFDNIDGQGPGVAHMDGPPLTLLKINQPYTIQEYT